MSEKICTRCNINDVYYYAGYCYDCLLPEERAQFADKVVANFAEQVNNIQKLSPEERQKEMLLLKKKLEALKQKIYESTDN